MAMAIDPAELLCRQGNTPSDLLNAMTPSPLAHNVPHMPGIVSVPSPLTAAPGLSGPPGLDVPQPYSAEAALMPPTPGCAIHAWALEATLMPPPPGRCAIHAWALEAKINAEQAQARQRQWAEKIQLQYIQGQSILKALQPEDSGYEEAAATGGAFDRLVKQMGLKTETPRSTGQGEPVMGQTPPSKQQGAAPGTPPKADVSGRRRGEKENFPWPSEQRGWGGAKEESWHGSTGRRNRGRRAQTATHW